jgi:hypothetical protein
MKRPGAGPILVGVSARWAGAARRCAAGAAFLACIAFASTTARAGTSTIEVGDQAVVQVSARNGSDVAVRTWERPAVQVETDDEGIQIARRAETFGTVQNPMSAAIPVTTIRVPDASGVPGSATLPPEDFPYAANMRTGVHDVVRINAGIGTRTTVTVPAGAAIVVTRILGAGNLTVSNYQRGTLFIFQNAGRARLENIGAATFAQVLNGRLIALDSSFDRVRARGNTTAMIFERCRAKQIEVTTHGGPIVYDDGAFDQGLARFESTDGLIAIGLAGSASVSGRTQTGRVLAMFDRVPHFDQRSEGEATAVIGNGGAIVNAVTGHGNIFLYDGALTARRVVPPQWRALHTALLRQSSAPAAPSAPFVRRQAVERLPPPIARPNRAMFRLR